MRGEPQVFGDLVPGEGYCRASAGEVGDPYFLGGPLARPLGAGQRVIGMIRSIWRGVELVQSVDEEAAAAQDLDLFAVAGWNWIPHCDVARRCAWRCG